MTYNPDFPELVPPDEEAASVAGLELAPWVAAQALPIREAHLAQRRAELDVTVANKVARWRRGEYGPAGAHHER